ncbi:MAG TPA: hypothetical protein VN442_14630 [Bryobacteraceae bacterium]|nr:hypothetical protein [Bryobacteraceae bacterium]
MCGSRVVVLGLCAAAAWAETAPEKPREPEKKTLVCRLCEAAERGRVATMRAAIGMPQGRCSVPLLRADVGRNVPPMKQVRPGPTEPMPQFQGPAPPCDEVPE